MTRTKTALISLLAASTFLLLGSCAGQSAVQKLRHRIEATPAKWLSNYAFNPDSSLAERVQPVPALLLDYLKQMDNVQTYAAYTLTPEEKAEMQQYLSLLPVKFQQVFRNSLVGIYFVADFLGSGMADWVLDNNDKLYTILIINPAVLHSTISDWLTYRETTCFVPGTGEAQAIHVRVDCGTAYSGLLYTLLHEGTHLYDYIEHITPYTEEFLYQLLATRNKSSFTDPVWQAYSLPQSHYDFTGRKDITFYGFNNGPKATYAQAAQLYASLSKTPFVSLYATMSWAEDLAESFSWYHYTRVLKQSYQIELLQDDNVIFSFKPDFDDSLPGRLAVLESLSQ